MTAITCPSCGADAVQAQTKYGRRDRCDPCGLWSWDGKPLVSKPTHEARKCCHEAFDRIWKAAETAYEIREKPGTKEHGQLVKKLRRAMRNRAYHFIAFKTGLPEPECHMATQEDIAKLRLIYRAAKDATPTIVREWWKAEGLQLTEPIT